MAYPRPSLTVDAVVLAGSGEAMQLLVIERAKDPFQGHWALPGGFVDPGEIPLTACLRELEEETGLVCSPTGAQPLLLRAREGRDPRGWTISQPFLIHLGAPRAVKGGDDARQARWIPLAQLSTLAFDHGAVLCEALGRFWQIMPFAVAALRGIRAFGEPDDYGDIVTFYGGSFNPLHEGHLACVHGAPQLDRVVVVPDTNPFKAGPVSRCYWALYRELQQAFKDCLAVFPGFCGMETPNPTAGWLPHVRGIHAGLLIGEDSLLSLPRWYDVAQLIGALNHLVVIPRRAAVHEVSARLAWVAAKNPSTTVILGSDHPWRDLSSTHLRNTQT